MTQPLRILFVGASPPGEPPIRVDLECRRLREALRHRPEIQLVPITAGTFQELQRELIEHDYQVGMDTGL